MMLFKSLSLLALMLCFTAALPLSTDSMLVKYEVSNKSAVPVRLTKELKEISGITVSKDGRLFAHNDEKAAVYQVEPATGKILREFALKQNDLLGGKEIIKDDFEDISVKDSTLYLITSTGIIYEFSAGGSEAPQDGDKKSVPYKIHKTFLGGDFDIEGLCYDEATDALLIACKEFPQTNPNVRYPQASTGDVDSEPKGGKKKYKAVFSFSLKTMTVAASPRFLLPLEKIKKESKADDFKPSAIARHPSSGTFFIAASQGHLLIEVAPDGTLLGHAKLPRGLHPQPEGVAFAPDGTLYLSNEANADGNGDAEKNGTLYSYPLQK